METDKNPFPTIDLFPKLTQAAKVIGSFLLERHSTNRGGGPFLDAIECPDYVEDGQMSLW